MCLRSPRYVCLRSPRRRTPEGAVGIRQDVRELAVLHGVRPDLLEEHRVKVQQVTAPAPYRMRVQQPHRHSEFLHHGADRRLKVGVVARDHAAGRLSPPRRRPQGRCPRTPDPPSKITGGTRSDLPGRAAEPAPEPPGPQGLAPLGRTRCGPGEPGTAHARCPTERITAPRGNTPGRRGRTCHPRPGTSAGWSHPAGGKTHSLTTLRPSAIISYGHADPVPAPIPCHWRTAGPLQLADDS